MKRFLEGAEVNNRILIVDDNHALHEDYLAILSPSQSQHLEDLSALEDDLFGDSTPDNTESESSEPVYEVDSAYQGVEAIQMVRKAAAKGRPYALIFMDVRMPPGIDGIETIARIWQEFPYTEMVICTAYSDYSWDEIVERLGASDKLLFLKKPFTGIAIKQMAQSLLTKWNFGEESRRYTRMLEEEVKERTQQLQLMLYDLHQKNEELLEAQADLQETEEKFNILTKSSNNGIVLMDNDGKISFWNPAAQTMFGYSPDEAVGTAIQTLIIPKAFRTGFRGELDAFRQAEPDHVIGKTLELYAERKDGSEIPVEISVSALQVRGDWYAAAIIRDISERKAAEEELKRSHQIILQQEKMASIGQLAAGVAHEINNPTGFVFSNLGTLEKYIGRLNEFLDAQSQALNTSDNSSVVAELAATRKNLKIDHIKEDIRDIISESLDGVDRIKNIVAGLKGFARVGETEAQPVNLNECLDMTLNIVWNELKYKCTLQKDYSDLPATFCFPQQLSQVFVNILVNAAHAIEKQGKISIKTFTKEGTNIIEISDTGSGIPADKINKIFDPFFTTKEVGKGTGLGLSISYDIIKKHRGDIRVESEVGVGTTFQIELPIIEEQKYA